MNNIPFVDIITLKSAFAKAGWFIPPYATMETVFEIAERVRTAGEALVEVELEDIMYKCYNEISLGAMIVHRYPITPFVRDYKVTIAEAVEAHFFGLHHVAVSALLPVIEGVGRQLAAKRGIAKESLKHVITGLGEDFIREALEKRMGDTEQVKAMVESFVQFTREFLYVQSDRYPLPDMTNRHGIAHGAYADAQYGTATNFFKVIAAVNFLTFIASATEGISWFAPTPDAESINLSARYAQLSKLRTSYGPVSHQTSPIDWTDIMVVTGFIPPPQG